ncbi:MAG: hypothetical protein ACLS95_07400 [Clostridia bacterium]
MQKKRGMKMKKEQGITLVSLVVTIIILIILTGISINLTIGDNGIITKAKQAKQNITLAGEAEAIQLNQLYEELAASGQLTEDEESGKKDEIITLLQKKVEELQNQLDNLNSLLIQTNATDDKILSGYKAYSGGKLLTGTMANRGAITNNLNAGESYTIPEGYHNGGGKVTANSLASQTIATATVDDIAQGKTAWVNGNLITGILNHTKSVDFDMVINIHLKTSQNRVLEYDKVVTIKKRGEEVTFSGYGGTMDVNNTVEVKLDKIEITQISLKSFTIVE